MPSQRDCSKLLEKEQLSLHLYLTNHCNLECKYCYLNAGPDKKTYLNWDQIKNTLDFYRNNQVSSVYFSGGEALTSPYIFKAIDYAHEIGYQKITIATNGISPAIFQIPNRPYIQLYFSLDGFSPKTHDQVRGSGSFNLTINNIKKAAQNGYKTFVNITINKQNLLEIIPLIYFLDELEINTIGLNFLSLKGRAKNNTKLSITPTTWRKIYKSVTSINNLKHSTIRIPPNFLTKKEIDFLDPNLIKCLLYSPTKHELTHDGELFNCCLLVGQPKYAGGKLKNDQIVFDRTNETKLLKDISGLVYCPARHLEFPNLYKSSRLIPVCFYYRTVIKPQTP